MGRCLPRELSELGWRIYDRMRELALDPPEIAAAAGISPSTLYRIMRADRGATVDPRLRTKRRLARALKVPMARLFNDSQLELYELPINAGSERFPLERLMLHQYRTIDPQYRSEAGRNAAFTLVDFILSVADDASELPEEGVGLGVTDDRREDLLILLVRRLPEKMRRYGIKAAIQSMLKVQRAHAEEPSELIYRPITRTNWSESRIDRDKPPLRAELGRSRRKDTNLR